MNLEHVLSERRQTKEHTLCNSILMTVQIGTLIQAKNRLVVARGWKWGKLGCKGFFWGVLDLDNDYGCTIL